MDEAKKNTLYISDGLVSFDHIDNLYNKIFLIHAPCAYGKTTYVNEEGSDGLLAALNKRKEELKLDQPQFSFEDMILLVPRKAVKTQQESKNVKVETYHSITKEEIKRRRVVICDEAHCPYDEIYADSYNEFFDNLFDCGDDVVKIFITATPNTLREFHGIEYEKITIGEIPPKFYANEIFISISGKVKNALNTYLPALGASKKALVFLPSSSKCEKYASEWNVENKTKADFQVSEYSKQKTKEGQLLIERMDYEARKAILELERLPQDVIVEFLTKAFEVGVNFSDENLKLVIIQAFNPDTIVQELGRVRHDIELAIVILDIYGAREAINNMEKMVAARQEWEALDDPGKKAVYLKEIYDKAKDGKMPHIVRKHDEYEYEWSVRGWNAVNANAYYGAMALNYVTVESGGSPLYNAFEYYDFSGNAIRKPLASNRFFYINLLKPYSRTEPQIRNFNYTNKENQAERNKNWAEIFAEEGKEWLGKKLFKEEQDKMAQQWGGRIIRSQSRKAGITTVLKALEESGYFEVKKGQAKNPNTNTKTRYVQIELK